jgi:hypothetical protein
MRKPTIKNYQTITRRDGSQVNITINPEQVKNGMKPATEKIERAATGKKDQPEYQLQKQFAQWLQWQHPNVFFSSDTVAQIKLTFPQQARNKAIQKADFKWPDIFIAEMRGEFGGLFIELKAETPYLKDGITLKKNEHVETQAICMDALRDKGYCCQFAWTFEQCVRAFETYIGL